MSLHEIRTRPVERRVKQLLHPRKVEAAVLGVRMKAMDHQGRGCQRRNQAGRVEVAFPLLFASMFHPDRGLSKYRCGQTMCSCRGSGPSFDSWSGPNPCPGKNFIRHQRRRSTCTSFFSERGSLMTTHQVVMQVKTQQPPSWSTEGDRNRLRYNKTSMSFIAIRQSNCLPRPR